MKTRKAAKGRRSYTQLWENGCFSQAVLIFTLA